MKNILLLAFLIFGQFVASAQNNFPLSNDPLYWKNRKPHANYWQQDVHYKINAAIDETNHTISAHQSLQYWNNSPDTLHFVYFHLHQNAFVKGSYAHALQEANKVKPVFGRYENSGLGTTVENITINGVAPTKTEIDFTILKIFLPQPLQPGKNITIDMDFVSYFDIGSTRRRMKMYPAWGFMHYNGCQWFPKICVYDAKFGWDTYQHLGKEFYGDFGVYDVTLDFASNYIVEASGILQNREEVLPKDLREKLDLKNFAQKPWNEPPSEIIPYRKGERKKWHFVAHHVHDFAFTADPSYRIATEYWNGIECVGIAQEPHASGWQNAAQLVAKIVQTFSENYGMYHYPKMVAADAADGMEYPMLTLDGGADPGYRGLLVHEIGHNWFYGMVGSNETYRAALDEGFTQFLTAEGLRKIDGDTMVQGIPKGWRAKFAEPRLAIDSRVYYSYIYGASSGGDHQLNTHSDDFGSALGHGGGYGNVYYKTATMLYNLQYVLGDKLFADAMLHYFNQWKFAHPYFEDFRNSIIQYTKVDLNWFFDQWLETTKPIDYAIGKIKKTKEANKYAIAFKRRRTSMQMPIDFTVTDKNGNRHHYYIPNTWFEKNTNAQTLPRWIGWGKLNQNYTAYVNIADGIKSVTIDTSFRFADRFMLNNTKTLGSIWNTNKIITKLDGGIYGVPEWKKYKLYIRPDIWYNAIDGIKIGANFEGNYLNNILNINGNVWYNTTIGRWYNYYPEFNEKIYQYYAPINYRIIFSTPLTLNIPNLKLNGKSRFLDGLWWHQLGFNWAINDKNNISAYAKTMHRSGRNTDYLLYPQEWSSTQQNKNTSFNVQYNKIYKTIKGGGYYTFGISTPMLTRQFDYSYVHAELKHLQVIHKMLWSTRFYGRIGMGNNIPFESALFLAGASPEEMMENKYVRSMAFFPQNWLGYSPNTTNHFQNVGGLNLRGYAGYYAYDTRNGKQYVAYKSRSGFAINTEVDFTNYFKFKPKYTRNWLKANVYLFADAGIVELADFNTGVYYFTSPTNYVSDFRMDAGLGFAITVKKWGVFEKAKPLTIRVDLPFFLNRPTFTEPQYWGARWVLGINKAI